MKGNGNGGRSPHEIQAEIERTRSEMDHTLSAIEHRLTPGQLVDQGLDYLKNSGARQYFTNLGGSVRDNPVPVALAGIGLAWLMAVANRPVQYKFVETAGGSQTDQTAGQRLGEMKDRASERLGEMKGRVAGTAGSLAEGARRSASQIGDTARQLGDTAQRQAQRARDGWDTMLNEHPLALGAVGLAIGAVAAAMVPRTRTEDEWMGEASDSLVDQAKQAGAETLQQAKQAGAASLQQAKDALGAVKAQAGADPRPEPAAEPHGASGPS